MSAVFAAVAISVVVTLLVVAACALLWSYAIRPKLERNGWLEPTRERAGHRGESLHDEEEREEDLEVAGVFDPGRILRDVKHQTGSDIYKDRLALSRLEKEGDTARERAFKGRSEDTNNSVPPNEPLLQLVAAGPDGLNTDRNNLENKRAQEASDQKRDYGMELYELSGIDVSKLVLGDMVGRGTNGHVFRGTYMGAEVAVKELSSNSADGFLSELEALRRLRHPHIIGLYGAAIMEENNPVWPGQRGELSRRYLLVTELAPCSLRDLLDTDEAVSFDLALRFATEISKGCAFIHSMKYVHFDIKPANVLLSEAGRIKICDLGISRHFGTDSTLFRVSDKGGIHGTPAYMAPEVLRAGPGSSLSYEVDVYSFSLVFWEILHRRSPHPTEWTIARLFSKLLSGHRPVIGALVPARIRRMLTLGWAKEPQRRPNFERILVQLTWAAQEYNQPAAAFLAAQDVQVWTKGAFCPGRISRNRGDGKYEVRLATDPTKVQVFHANEILLVEGEELEEGNDGGNNNMGGASTSHIAMMSAAATSGALKSAAAKRLRDSQNGPKRMIFSVFDDEKLTTSNSSSSSGDSISNSISSTPQTTRPSYDLMARVNRKKAKNGNRGQRNISRADAGKDAGKDVGKDEHESDATDDLISTQGSSDSCEDRQDDSMLAVVIDGIHINKYGVRDVTASNRNGVESNEAMDSPVHLFSERLVQLDELGRGATGTVYSALQLDTFQLVAVKSIKIADAGSRAQIAKEIRAIDSTLRRGMIETKSTPSSTTLAAAAAATGIAGKKGQNGADSALNAAHDKQKMTEKQLAELEKHLIQVIDVFYAPEEASVKIVMEYMNGGSCDDLMKRGELLDETALAAIAIGAINSLVALHAKQRMHRDIKPANVLIDSKHGAKLCDLGLARHMLATKGGESHENDAVADTFVGTISYMSVERLEGKSYSYPADVHALGLTLLALALGSNPMRNLSFFQLLELLRSADCIQVPPEIEARYEPAFCQMLRDCTRSKPELRPTAKELQEYEWVKKYQRPDMPDSQNVLLSLIERTSEGPRYKRDMVNSIVARTNAHYVKTNMNRSKPRKVVVSLSKVRTLSEQLRVPVRQTIKAFKYNAANI